MCIRDSLSTDLGAASSALDQAAAANPTFASSQAYADAKAALQRASGRAATIEQTSSTIASDAATANAKVQSFVAQHTAVDAKSKPTTPRCV